MKMTFIIRGLTSLMLWTNSSDTSYWERWSNVYLCVKTQIPRENINKSYVHLYRPLCLPYSFFLFSSFSLVLLQKNVIKKKGWFNLRETPFFVYFDKKETKVWCVVGCIFYIPWFTHPLKTMCASFVSKDVTCGEPQEV